MAIQPGVGDIITYEAFGGVRRTVRVTSHESDIKNGRPGFDGVLVTQDGTPIQGDPFGGEVWGYDDQITGVIALVQR